ncbi:MAG TPA: hypothetical protein VFB90_01650 [Dehalococcoidia bacterium]|nr:hypothetical protein [Dehalococcoidia bacterium]
MNQVNRVLIIGLALVLIVAMAALSFLLWADSSQLSSRVADLSTFLSDHNGGSERLIITFAALLGMVLALLVVLLEISPESVSDDLAVTGRGATLVVPREATSQHLAGALLQLPDVLSADVQLDSGKGTIAVEANLVVDPEAAPAQIRDAAVAALDSLLLQELGVHLDPASRIRVTSGQRLGDALDKLTPPSAEAGIGPNQA